MTGSSRTGRPACRWRCASWRPRAIWPTCARPPPTRDSAGPGAAATTARCSWTPTSTRRWRRSAGSSPAIRAAPGGPGQLRRRHGRAAGTGPAPGRLPGLLHPGQRRAPVRAAGLQPRNVLRGSPHPGRGGAGPRRGQGRSGHEERARRLMAVAQRVADHLVATFGGQEPGWTATPSSRPRWLSCTGRPASGAYLDLAAQFVDAARARPGRRLRPRPSLPAGSHPDPRHAHRRRPRGPRPVPGGRRDRRRRETGDTALLACSIRRWEDMVATKTYLTGGNGPGTQTRRSATGSNCPPTGPTTKPAPPSPASTGPGGCCWPPATPVTPT